MKMLRESYILDIDLHCGNLFEEEPYVADELRKFTKEQLAFIEELTDRAYVHGRETGAKYGR